MGALRSRIYKGERVWFIDYIAANGERIRQTVGPGEENRRLARKALAEREAEARLGILNLPPARTERFGEFAEDWLQRAQARVKPKTYDLYASAVRVHLLPAFGQVKLGSITRRSIEQFLTEKRTGTRRGRRGSRVPFAPNTINILLTVLKMILEDAVDQGMLSDNPAARVKRLRGADQQEQMHILQPTEVARLLDAAGNPWRTLYVLAIHTGLRLGELLGLRWRDIDLDARTLYVRRTLGRSRGKDGGPALVEGTPKSKAGWRRVELSPTVYEALLAHPAGDDPERDFVFRSRTGEPLDAGNVRTAFRRHLTLAGLPEIRFHDLRHTHASLLIAAGVHPKAIQARLGHSSIQTTMNVYGHLMPSAFEGVGEKVEALLQGKLKANEVRPASNPAS